MRLICAFLFWSIFFTAVPLWGETYQWIDDKGTTHFSDDTSSIPKKLRNKVNKIDDSISHTNAPSGTTSMHTESNLPKKTDEINAEKYKRGSAEFVALERQLNGIWNSMRQALRKRNIEAALAYFTESTRDAFRSEFTALRKDLPQIAEEMGETRLVKVEEDSLAECDLRRVENGTTFSYMLQFVRDYDGIWRIRTF